MRHSRTENLSIEDAESLAIKALIFLTENEDQLNRFITLTGLTAENFREHAQSRSFLAGVLDYFMSDESLLLVFCSNANIDPARVDPAHKVLESNS